MVFDFARMPPLSSTRRHSRRVWRVIACRAASARHRVTVNRRPDTREAVRWRPAARGHPAGRRPL